MNKRFLHFVSSLLFLNLFYTSCDFNFDNIIEYKEEEGALWSILIYMSADNDLEYSAMEDIFEMECSKLNTKKVSVFFLLDRSEDFDTSNGDWSGTRLYQLKTGRLNNEKKIISEEIQCPELGLKPGNNVNLDMSSHYVLSDILSYIGNKYPARNLGLIIWGHGTGWRSSVSEKKDNIFKGVAYDNSSGSYITLKQLGEGIKKGLNGKKLDFLGLDTCFGGELEVMYELRNIAKYIIGTPGLLLMSGWNYTNIFNSFEHSKSKNTENFVKNIVEQFAIEYSQSLGASIVGVNTAFIEEYFYAFDEVMKRFANNICSRKDRDSIANILFSKSENRIVSYSYGKEESDVYVDINSMVEKLYPLYSSDNELKNSINKLDNLNDKCFVKKWNSNGEKGGLGVFFGTLTSGKFISSIHPESYIKGQKMEQIQFVSDSNGYVPNFDNNDSFLDKIFYTSFY